jgi:WD40 repeat protein
MLLVGDQAGVLKVWSTEDGTQIDTFSEPQLNGSEGLFAHEGAIKDLAFSPTGVLLASGGWGGERIRLWNYESRALEKTLSVEDRTNAISFSPDGAWFAAGLGTLTHSGTVRLWNTSDWSGYPELDGQTLPREVTAVAFSNDSKRLAVGDGRGRLQLWDLQTGEALVSSEPEVPGATYFRHPKARDAISGLAFAPSNDANLLSTTRNGVVTLWSMDKLGWMSWQRVDRFIHQLSYNAQRDELAFTTSDGAILLVHVGELAVTPATLPGRTENDAP